MKETTNGYETDDDEPIKPINIVKIQKVFRGYLLRRSRLPMILYIIQHFIQNTKFTFSNNNDDGRINSCIDEDEILKLLIEKFGTKIVKPSIRMWYDIIVFDKLYGWIPVNIKTTTTLTCDNSGSLAICVQAYTNKKLDVHRKNTYKNGEMSVILYDKLKKKAYNKKCKKDYYFLVLNKTNSKDVIINSLKGLTYLTPNSNNMPFQICWNKNRTFLYNNIDTVVQKFIECIKKQKQSWKEQFVANIKNLEDIHLE